MGARVPKETPRVLCVGGLDPSGRAGLLADAWAVQRAKAAPLAVATALTAQGGRRFSLNPVAPAVLRAQLEAARASGPLHAVKLGMVATPAQLEVIASALQGLAVPWVVDPVTSTSRGERLSRLSPRDYQHLAGALGRADTWLTPNQAELAWLGGSAEALLALGFAGVLVKGGDTALDVLFERRGQTTFRSRPVRRDRVHHRGTGCRLASALAARLGRGARPAEAVKFARRLVLQFLNLPILRARFQAG